MAQNDQPGAGLGVVEHGVQAPGYSPVGQAPAQIHSPQPPVGQGLGIAPDGSFVPGQSGNRADGGDLPTGHPLLPRDPHIQRRAVAPVVAPFVLSPEEQRQLDAVLQAWQQRSAEVKSFECQFTRFEYDPLFGDARKPRFEDRGQIKYAAPDKGLFKVDGPRPEQWICDGQAIFEYNYQKRQLIEHRLPPELRGRAIADGPLPFLFGADAQKLKDRYFLRITFSDQSKGEIWLEAFPKYQKDAASFRRAELILKGMRPSAVQIHSPNGKNRTVYVFENIRINERDPLEPLRLFRTDPFRAATPRGWQKVIEEAPPSQPDPSSPQLGHQPSGPMR